MRIVHLIFGLNVGGAETMLVDIVREQSLSAEVYVVVINNVYDQSVMASLNERVGVIRINRPASSRNPWYLVKLNRVLRQLKPDVVHAHGQHIVELIPFQRAPVVTTIHTTGASLTDSIHKCKKVFAISEAVKDDVLTRFGMELTVVNDGIDFSRMHRKESYGGTPFKVVQVSRLDHLHKGQDIVIQAVKHVNEKIGEGRLTVDFIGEGKSRHYLESLASELGVAQWCRFLGLRSRDETYKSLHNYDLLVQPSRFEGFGLTVVEGMAAGLPVLVSGVEGPMEIIDRGRHGFFFDTENYCNCGDKIIEVMELSQKKEILEMVSEVYDYARSRFDVRATAGNYLHEYRKAIHPLQELEPRYEKH